MTPTTPTGASPRRVTQTDALAGASEPRRTRSRWARTWPLLIAIVLTVGLIAVSILTGVADITAPDGEGREFLWITRIPRTASLVLAGASMAMAGLVMQLMTQNRFVEPTTVGTTEWAGLGLLTTYILLPASGILEKMAIAIAFAFAGTLVFFAFLRRVTLRSSLIVPIVGIMLGAVVSAVSTFLALRFNLLQVLGGWFMGRFTGIEIGRYEPLWIVLAVSVIVVIAADRFTVAGLGRDIATNVGLHYERVVLLGVGLVAMTTGVVTVIIGALPFLGLIVPNLVAMVRGDDLRSNLPWVFLTGIWIVTICDLIGRTIIMPFEVPIALVLGVVGSAVFIVMLLRARRTRVR
ncbi:ABC transporter permease [Microbacterium sp. NPDC089695]|uniref:ABC transporter permease n=1 Tax=Microbacterium sp. NPDC089695 TaxID=3364198 RepID=UPI0037FF3142